MKTMNTYYLDRGWRGGLVVVAESLEKAVELVKQSYHGKCVENLESKLKEEVSKLYQMNLMRNI